LRLGVSVYEVNRRVIVSRVDPGTPAAGRLFPNDQLVRAAFKDAQSGGIYRMPINSPGDIRRLKSLAGAGTRVALEVFRPTSGTRNFFVDFAPEGTTTPYTVTVNGVLEERTSIKTGQSSPTVREDTTGEAATWLDGAGQAQGAGNQPPGGGSQGNPESAADLLGP
jgi:hypothetical protein